MLEYHVLGPNQVQQVYEQVKQYLPDRCRTLDYFIQLYLRKDVMMFELGTFAGVFWLSDIVPGWRAYAHVIVWDDAARDQSVRGRGILKELMRLFRLRKLCALIPTTFEAAARFADKLGFAVEGVEKLADYYDGQLVDMMICGLYKEEV